MEWNDLLEFMKSGNTITTKFFGIVEDHDDIGPSLVAMANTKGGHLIIGVDVKNYHLVGTEINREWVTSLIKKCCNPKPEVAIDFTHKNDKVIVSIEIKKHNQKPYYYKNKCYVMDTSKTKLSLLEKEPEPEEENTELTSPPVNTESSLQEKKELEIITNELLSLNDELPEESHSIQSSSSDNVSNAKESLSFKKADSFKPVSEDKKTQTHDSIDTYDDLNERQQKAMAYIQTHHAIKNKTYRSEFNVSHKTAHIELVDLVSKGYIQSQGAGRSTQYVLSSNQIPSFL